MNAIAHNEFAPPPTGGFGKSLSFALFIHLLLLAALTWGIHWKTETQTLSASAELWSAVPAEAAPAANEPEPTPPEPEKPPEPVKKVEAKPEPKPTPTPPKANAAEREAADIALKKEKEKKKLEEKKQAELEKKKKLEKEKLEKEKEKVKEKEKAKDLEKKKKETAAKTKENDKKLAAEEKQAAAMRNENLKRMQGMAGASGDENAKGTAVKSSGPSASYAGRISKIIRDNITFPPDQLSTNPETRVLVTTNSDGLILTRRIIQSSGVKAWDDAVIRALEKTVRLPKDENGRMPDDGFNIAFRPKDN